MDAPEQQPADVVCAHCGRPLDLGSPDTTRLALLRDWVGYGGPEWDEAGEHVPREGEWRIRCVRPFCDADHARTWMAEGHPLPEEWDRLEPPPESSDLGCMLGCAAVLLVVACLLVLGAAEAWRIFF
ncbi:hypothetical protein [Nocardioides zeae]|uniref:Uncharacterized protein n=1 Tax=Nocardioides zeae TaxID=1457234 RepID=A0A6P0HHV8_9ACTN|nr:hypothetical protein [Nocardioides zeae]NEN78248.1 hypothetical protein [Nocardioides zeae]